VKAAECLSISWISLVMLAGRELTPFSAHAAGTANTGQDAPRTTRSVTLPSHRVNDSMPAFSRHHDQIRVFSGIEDRRRKVILSVFAWESPKNEKSNVQKERSLSLGSWCDSFHGFLNSGV